MKQISDYIGKSLKDFIDESQNNGKKIAHEIIKAYFGGYEPDKLSDEGMECANDDEIYKLIERMELYYVHDVDSKDPYDEAEIDAIHDEVTKWVKSHNK
jgi:hypothetical protein